MQLKCFPGTGPDGCQYSFLALPCSACLWGHFCIQALGKGMSSRCGLFPLQEGNVMGKDTQCNINRVNCWQIRTPAKAEHVLWVTGKRSFSMIGAGTTDGSVALWEDCDSDARLDKGRAQNKGQDMAVAISSSNCPPVSTDDMGCQAWRMWNWGRKGWSWLCGWAGDIFLRAKDESLMGSRHGQPREWRLLEEQSESTGEAVLCLLTVALSPKPCSELTSFPFNDIIVDSHLIFIVIASWLLGKRNECMVPKLNWLLRRETHLWLFLPDCNDILRSCCPTSLKRSRFLFPGDELLILQGIIASSWKSRFINTTRNCRKTRSFLRLWSGHAGQQGFVFCFKWLQKRSSTECEFKGDS